MKILVLCTALLLCAAAALGWQYSASTTWDGSHHDNGETTFTPGSTTAYLTECSPVWSGTPSCLSGAFWYTSRARLKLTNTTTEYFADAFCGGNKYTGPHTVTTNGQWAVEASIIQDGGQNQYSAQSPVGATDASSQVIRVDE